MSVVANVAVNLDSRDASSKLRGLQSQAQQTERAFGGLGAAVGKLAIAFSAIQAAKFVFVKTAELESQTRSLQVLTGSATKAAQIIQQLQQLGAVTPFTSTELIDSAKRLQAFGVETEKVVETTRRLADVSGATGAELQGLVTAYGQVQAKGRLQGEELLQFQERGVALQEVLRKEYKLSGEEFQKALSKGQISAEAVEYAIKKLTDAGGKYANGAIAQSDTLSGRLSTLQDGIEGLARSIGTALSPTIKAVLNEAIFAVNTINQLIATGARARSFGLGEAQRKSILNQAQQEAGQIVEGRRIRNPFERNRQFQELAAQRERDLIEAYGIRTGQVKPVAKAPTLPTAPPPLLMPTGGGKGAKGGRSDAETEAEKLAKELQRSLDRGNELFRQFSRQAALLGDITDNERKRLQIQYDFQDRARDINELKDKEQKTNLTQLNEEIRRLALLEQQSKELEDQIKLFYERAGFGAAPKMLPAGAGAFRTDVNLDPNAKASNLELMRQKLDDLVKTENQVKLGAESMGAAFGNAFKGVASGAMTAEQALANMMQGIAEYFLDMAAQIITQQITMIIYGTILKALGIGFSGGGGADFSGAFGGGGPSFNPGVFAGPSLAANGAMFSNGIAAFARGGIVGGPTAFQFADGAATRTGIMGEAGPEAIMPLQRDGSGRLGINAMGLREAMGSGVANGGPVLNMTFETQTINGVEYVSREQLELAMAETRRVAANDGARRGMSMTLDRIRQSPQTRNRIGLR